MLSRHVLISAAVCVGSISNINATVPATIGEAIDVPMFGPKVPAPAGCVDINSSPGAESVGARRPSRVGPRLEKVESVPFIDPVLAPFDTYAPAVIVAALVPGIEMVVARFTNGARNCAATFR